MNIGTQVFLVGPLKSGKAQLVDVIPAGAVLPVETAEKYFGKKGKTEGTRPIKAVRMVFLRDNYNYVVVPAKKLNKCTMTIH